MRFCGCLYQLCNYLVTLHLRNQGFVYFWKYFGSNRIACLDNHCPVPDNPRWMLCPDITFFLDFSPITSSIFLCSFAFTHTHITRLFRLFFGSRVITSIHLLPCGPTLCFTHTLLRDRHIHLRPYHIARKY